MMPYTRYQQTVALFLDYDYSPLLPNKGMFLTFRSLLWTNNAVKNIDFIAYNAKIIAKMNIESILTLDKKHFSRISEIEIIDINS